MKIAFVTDLHIDDDTQYTKGVNTRTHFIKALNALTEANPDLIVLGGDLCNRDGDEDIYLWIKDLMDNTKIPYHVIPGNHDDAKMMARIFYSEKGIECFRQESFDGTTCFFLDSSIGSFSHDQWSWFATHLSDDRNLIFVHHPVMLTGSKHMEPTYGFQQEKEFVQLLNNTNAQNYVITGHYHTDLHLSKGNIHMFVSPSTYLQVDHTKEHFEPIFDRIGYRDIEIGRDFFRTMVQYF